ncbi:hypothetical protein C9I92_06570 [Photobacterium ganghwense]|uniref:Uncharacterized protein n=1 Tax=Photobacterium ganghwense TaxID=320778 RepID=A0A0J1HE76_9GAMM|nr:hypothetical protein ABT57_09645 [Photobacterium ganghwense]PSU09226.1 hypothetical protein C9I92_06570 [Photobacterium ganghwense]
MYGLCSGEAQGDRKRVDVNQPYRERHEKPNLDDNLESDKTKRLYFFAKDAIVRFKELTASDPAYST